MSKGKWSDISRAKREAFTADQYEALITGIRMANPWDEIADRVSATKEVCQHVAKGMGLAHPDSMRRAQLREMGVIGNDEAEESAKDRDARYVAALLREGGFHYAEMRSGQLVHVWPDREVRVA